MVEVCVGMENADDGQTESLDRPENLLVITAWIDDNRLLRNGISEDRAVAAERRNWKRATDQLVQLETL